MQNNFCSKLCITPLIINISKQTFYFETAAVMRHRQTPKRRRKFLKTSVLPSFVFIPREKAFSYLILVPRNGRAALTSDVPDVTLMRAELSLVCGLTAIKLSER